MGDGPARLSQMKGGGSCAQLWKHLYRALKAPNRIWLGKEPLFSALSTCLSNWRSRACTVMQVRLLALTGFCVVNQMMWTIWQVDFSDKFTTLKKLVKLKKFTNSKIYNEFVKFKDSEKTWILEKMPIWKQVCKFQNRSWNWKNSDS